MFRLNWSIKQLTSLENHRKHSKVLEFPLTFYIGIILKFIPKIYSYAISLKLKQGVMIKAKEFMTFYIYNEIFVEGCYDVNFGVNCAPTIIDVGANTGLFALRMKQLYPQSNIICFEPYFPNYQQLQETLKINGLSDIKSFCKAVNDNPGKVKLFIHPTNMGGHSIYKQEAGDNYVEVQSIDLNNALSLLDETYCDLLKLDCEGAENLILRSINKDMANRIRRIIYEPTYSQYSVNDLNDHLKSIGYSVQKQKSLYIAKYCH